MAFCDTFKVTRIYQVGCYSWVESWKGTFWGFSYFYIVDSLLSNIAKHVRGGLINWSFAKKLRQFWTILKILSFTCKEEAWNYYFNLLKGQLISKGLFGFFSILPKKRTKNFCHSRLGQRLTFSSLFYKGLKTPKFPFEINWPLGWKDDSCWLPVLIQWDKKYLLRFSHL